MVQGLGALRCPLIKLIIQYTGLFLYIWDRSEGVLSQCSQLFLRVLIGYRVFTDGKLTCELHRGGTDVYVVYLDFGSFGRRLLLSLLYELTVKSFNLRGLGTCFPGFGPGLEGIELLSFMNGHQLLLHGH